MKLERIEMYWVHQNCETYWSLLKQHTIPPTQALSSSSTSGDDAGPKSSSSETISSESKVFSSLSAFFAFLFPAALALPFTLAAGLDFTAAFFRTGLFAVLASWICLLSSATFWLDISGSFFPFVPAMVKGTMGVFWSVFGSATNGCPEAVASATFGDSVGPSAGFTVSKFWGPSSFEAPPSTVFGAVVGSSSSLILASKLTFSFSFVLSMLESPLESWTWNQGAKILSKLSFGILEEA